MTVVFILCMAWTAEGVCTRASSIKVDTETWTEMPCSELLPQDLRPLLLGCNKTRSAGT